MESAMKSAINLAPDKHSVFISYSWDSDSHLAWIDQLSRILEKAGIQTIVDRKDFLLGDPLQLMMEEAIVKCEYVLFVCTPNYKKKADEHKGGGVTYEDTIITGEIFQRQNHRKYIPIYPYGKITESTPNWAIGKNGVDMSSEKKYYDGLKRLVNTIAPEIPYPIKTMDSSHSFFYELEPYFQIKILDGLSSWINDLPYYSQPHAIEHIYFLLQDVEKERLTPEVMVSWNKAYIEFEADYHELILQDMQDNPG